jgi:hypothetical protein
MHSTQTQSVCLGPFQYYIPFYAKFSQAILSIEVLTFPTSLEEESFSVTSEYQQLEDTAVNISLLQHLHSVCTLSHFTSMLSVRMYNYGIITLKLDNVIVENFYSSRNLIGIPDNSLFTATYVGS